MPRVYGHDLYTARVLKKVAMERSREYQEEHRRNHDYNVPLNIQGRVFIVVLDTPVIAAVPGSGDWTMSSGIAQVYYRSPVETEGSSQDPDNTITGTTLTAFLDSDGNPVYRRVYNPTLAIAAADTPLEAIQDVYGDLYLINATSSSTPPTPVTGILFKAIAIYSGDPMPAHGVMWKAGVGEELVGSDIALTVTKPYRFFDIHWFINRDTVVYIDGTGYCDTFMEKPGPVRIDASLAGTINVGEELGPKPNSFTIWPGYKGFHTVGPDYVLDGVRVVDCIQRPVVRQFGRVHQDLTQDASGTAHCDFEIWYRNPSDGKRSPAGWDYVQAYGPLLNKNEKVKQGTFGFIDYGRTAGQWEGDFACDPDNTNTSQTGVPGSQNSPAPGFPDPNPSFTNPTGTGNGFGTGQGI